MNMTQEQLVEFKKQFSIYQQQYYQLNQQLLMQNNINAIPSSNSTTTDQKLQS